MLSKFNQFVQDNYVTVSEKTVHPYDTVVVVFKAKEIESVPKAIIEYFEDNVRYASHIGRGRRLFGGNADLGDVDAIVVKEISFNKLGNPTLAKVFITAILREPFTEEQQCHYERLCGLPLKERIFYPWDSFND